MNHDDNDSLLKLLMTLSVIFVAKGYDQSQPLYQPVSTGKVIHYYQILN